VALYRFDSLSIADWIPDIAAMADACGLPVCPHHSALTDVPGIAAVSNGLFHEYAGKLFEPVSRMVKASAKPSGE